MDKKIIAISGTHGTGKTFLAYNLCVFLKKHGKNVVVLNELARESPFPINRECNDLTQIWLITKQITKELELYNRYEYIIVDRSVLDAYCYGLINNDSDWIYKHLYNYIINHINKFYKKLYILDPTSFNYNIEDGVRDTDDEFRINVHNTMVGVLNEANIPYINVFNDITIYNDFN